MGRIEDTIPEMVVAEANTLGVSAESELPKAPSYPLYIGSVNIELGSKAVLAVDVESGEVLLEKNSQDLVLPASTSKIITALVSLESYSLDQKVTVPPMSIEGQKIGLSAGEILTVEDLIYALLVSSANDAAETLARIYPGGRDLFIAQMNVKAQNLGLTSSVFLNPTGLDAFGQATTAKDLVRASFYAMQNPIFEKVVATKRYYILGDDGQVKYTLSNINQLLGNVDGVVGIKTGKTDGALENLITYVKRGKGKVILAVLGSNDRFSDTEKAVEWIFNSYSWGSD